MERAKPKLRRPAKLNASLEEALVAYADEFTAICDLIQSHWPSDHWIPTIKEEILGTMYLVFVKAYRDRDRYPLLFPPPAPLFYSRVRWALVKQWVPRESIHRHHILEPYDTLEHWHPGHPEIVAIVHFDDQYRDSIALEELTEVDSAKLFPYKWKMDILDFWYLGCSTAQIAVLYNISTRTVLRTIHSFYDAIEKRIMEAHNGEMKPIRPPSPRPTRGRYLRSKTC